MVVDPFGSPAPADDDFSMDVPLDTEGDSKWQIPHGQYAAKVIALSKGTSSKGNPQWIWEFALLAPENLKGRTFKDYTALTPAAMWKLTMNATALGLLAAGQTRLSFKKSEAIGKRCILDIEDDEYNGKKNSKIAKVLPPSEDVKALKDGSAAATPF